MKKIFLSLVIFWNYILNKAKILYLIIVSKKRFFVWVRDAISADLPYFLVFVSPGDKIHFPCYPQKNEEYGHALERFSQLIDQDVYRSSDNVEESKFLFYATVKTKA